MEYFIINWLVRDMIHYLFNRVLEIEEFGSIVQNYCLCDPVKYIIVYIKISKGGKFLNISARRIFRDQIQALPFYK